MFDLGFSGLTVASHVTICLAIFMVFDEALRLAASPDGLKRALSTGGVRVAVFAALSAVVVERVYYIAARLLRPLGLDLWSQHPAPELLAASVAVTLFLVVVAGRVASSLDSHDWVVPMFLRAMSLVVVWSCVAFWLA